MYLITFKLDLMVRMNMRITYQIGMLHLMMDWKMNKEQQELLDDAYENFIKSYTGKDDEIILPPFDYINDDGNLMSKNQFITNIKYDYWFSEKWGLKIKERELSLEERYDLCVAQKSKMTAISEEDYIKYNIPTKLITITYNDKTIESYE